MNTASGAHDASRGDPGRGPRAFALYPHAREFSHVVALDAPWPCLTVRRRERRNALKVIGTHLGLFPRLTPSFAIAVSRGDTERLLERLLGDVAEQLGEPTPAAEVLIATRSNCAVIHTAPRSTSAEPRGRWTLHVPLQPRKARMLANHFKWLEALRDRFPSVPAPAPLFHGVAAGLTVTVEQRVDGVTGADVTGDRAATSRMFDAVADALAGLVLGGPAALTPARYEATIAARAALAASHAPSAGTRGALTRLVDEARERLVGQDLPAAAYHADLRGKHVAVREDGALLAFLDWGASEDEFLPYVDLMHFVLHQRKQEEGGSFRDVYALVRDDDRLRPHERGALERYRARVGLDASVCRALERLYPVFVAGMAERNWDFSRPEWVHRHFGL